MSGVIFLLAFDNRVACSVSHMVSALARNLVRLSDGPIRGRQLLCGRYLLELDPDRLLHNFRVNAGLPSSALPLGGWESPACGLRGHFTGHYLSACSQMYASTGDERFRDRAGLIVEELARCQRSSGGNYLSAFPVAQFDTLERGEAGAWAPYYTLHKILAGLLEANRSAKNEAALDVAGRLGDWVVARMKRLPGSALDALLRTDDLNPLNEYGGIGESMYLLSKLTGQASHFETAKLFDRDWFLDPLMQRRDILAGLHANTHIPQALAAARRYEITGDERYRRAVEYFWERTALARSYVNGGSSGPRPDRRERSEGGEHWPQAFRLGGTLTPKINESCVANNMLRLTDVLFGWTQNTRYAEFRERIYLNSVLAMQHPGGSGRFIYSHPLAPGSRKVFGDFDNTFWCCYGTSIESHACLGDGIYFESGNDLWVAQYVASEATWAEKKVRVIQKTGFPREQSTTLEVQTAHDVEFTLHLRIPGWAHNASWKLSGSSAQSGDAGCDWFSIRRVWRSGDTIELKLPMSLRTEPLPGDDHEIAFLFGPTVLAARSPHGLELGVTAAEACTAVKATDVDSLRFAARLGFGGEVPLVAVNEIVDEPFGVYFKSAR
jgi:DUF1680 family protein